jgi:hypothetical protein
MADVARFVVVLMLWAYPASYLVATAKAQMRKTAGIPWWASPIGFPIPAAICGFADRNMGDSHLVGLITTSRRNTINLCGKLTELG